MTFSCTLPAFWDHINGSCVDVVAFWTFDTAFSMAISLIIMALPVIIVYPLQMTLGRKAQAIGAFLLQLPLCGFAVVRLLYLRRVYRSDDLIWESVEWQIWTQIALHFTVMAKNMPCLKMFLEGMILSHNRLCF